MCPGRSLEGTAGKSTVSRLETVLLRSLHTIFCVLCTQFFAFFAHNFLRSLRAFYFFFAAAAVRRRLVALERDGRDKVFHAQHLVGERLVDELPEIRLGRDGAALALKLSGAERVRSVEELRQILDRVTVEVVNGLLDAEFFDLV